MDAIQNSVTQLTGAVNSVLEQLRSIENRIAQVERSNPTQTIETIVERLNSIETRITMEEGSGWPGIATPRTSPEPLRGPSSEAELNAISRLPDCVKELQVFDGNPINYVSWVHSVETILKDYDIIRSKPLYRAILQHIRQKIRGKADSALISYNILDADWKEVKRVLSLHYADKRDIRTLEHQLNQLKQGGLRVDDFYARVNHQFSLIISKIRAETYSSETADALVGTYRDRALDVFVRGLSGDLSRLLIIQKPKTLPEAYSACLEMQNLNFRNNSVHVQAQNTISAPVYYDFRTDRVSPPSHRNQGRFNNNRNEFVHRQYPSWNASYNNRQYGSPPRPTGPKPAIKMEVDNSSQSKNVNYMNRPANNPFKREKSSDNYQNKRQRLFHTVAEVPESINEPESNPVVGESEKAENFMLGASFPAYHT